MPSYCAVIDERGLVIGVEPEEFTKVYSIGGEIPDDFLCGVPDPFEKRYGAIDRNRQVLPLQEDEAEAVRLAVANNIPIRSHFIQAVTDTFHYMRLEPQEA